jgi:hypothetical protein
MAFRLSSFEPGCGSMSTSDMMGLMRAVHPRLPESVLNCSVSCHYANQAQTIGTTSCIQLRRQSRRMAVPGVRRVAILVDDSNPVNVEEARQVQAAADELGVKSATLGIRRAEDIVPAFEGLKDRADAL